MEGGGNFLQGERDRERMSSRWVVSCCLKQAMSFGARTAFTVSQKSPYHDLNSRDGDRELGDGDYDSTADRRI